MICTGVIPCLSSGLAKNKLIKSMFVLFPGFVGFESFAFPKIGEGVLEANLAPKQSNRMFLVNFSKVRNNKVKIFQKARLY